MKLFTFIISLLILSCNSQKKVTKEKAAKKNNIKTEVVETIKVNLDTTKTVTKTTVTPKTNTKNNTVKNNNQQTQIEVLTEGSHGGYIDSKYLVIKDQKTLQQVYSKINMIRRPGIPVPKIDWSKEMVIALFMGQKNYGGYTISVDKITDNNTNVEFLLKETKPEDMATTVICQPFYFCKVKRTDKNIIFKKVE